MGFKLNGVNLLPPTQHHWIIPKSPGIDGDGRTLYGAFFGYELDWDSMPDSDFRTLVQQFNAQGSTGTTTTTLPQYAITGTYPYHDYPGTLMTMPEFSTFFEGNYQSVKLVINHVLV